MRRILMRGLIGLWAFLAISASAADTLTWHTNQENGVSADIQSIQLPRLLEGVSQLTGWQIFLEPGTTHTVSAKFKDLAPGNALRLLLGDLNFALVPQSNASPRLYVFRTERANATVLLHPKDLNNSTNGPKVIPNELVVRLKPGADIDAIAKALGAKVVGRIPGLNAYRLRFDDAESADAARKQLADNPDVAGVESNYLLDPAPPLSGVAGASVPPLQLSLNPPQGTGEPVIGLIDSKVDAQALGGGLDKFLKKSISVAGEAPSDLNSPSHGTAMFESLLRAASAITGSSSSLQVVNVDVYGPNESANTFDVAAGIALAVNNGANIINLSLGSTADSPVLNDIIQEVIQQHIPVFAANGNNGKQETFYPAAYPNVIAVTASENGQLAPYANYGNYTSLILPGQSVFYFYGQPYISEGTSVSSAAAAGVAAGIADAKHLDTTAAADALSTNPAWAYHSQGQ